MEGAFGKDVIWYPFASLGITHPLTGITVSTVINTWIALAALLVVIFIGRYFISKKNSVGEYIVFGIVKSFMQLVEQSAGTFVYRYFMFIGSLFTFILFCNCIALIPWVEEPTKDLNTTLAFGFIAFMYVQKEIVHVHGFWHYVKDYFAPFKIFFPLNLLAGLAVLPLKLLGEAASVISLAFRLFGNIFGGAIIMSIFHRSISNSIILQTTATMLGAHLILTGFFIIFEGFLQAFVFSILTVTNIAMATAIEESDQGTTAI